MTLLDFNHATPITYLWLVTSAHPAGIEFCHAPDAEGDDWCDFRELDLLDRLWDLRGSVDDRGRWCWDGAGELYDAHLGAVLNLKAR